MVSLQYNDDLTNLLIRILIISFRQWVVLTNECFILLIIVNQAHFMVLTYHFVTWLW
jgi:hypothetical protein